MLFNSFEFVVLLLVTFLLYYTPKLSRFQIDVLIVSSLVFYSYSEPIMVLLLLFSVSVNIVSSYQVVYGHHDSRKFWASAGVILNLGILIFFKYSPLLARTFLNEDNSAGALLMKLPLPIGISFFTFQGISLVIDVYREKYAPGISLVPKSLLAHARQILFFKAFFPQLVSGPIVKAHDFIPQIAVKTLSNVNWNHVVKILITGYFLKMVIADNLKEFTFWISYPYFEQFSSITLLFMLFGYSFQIFADFAGYSLIAIGLAALFGYQFKDNFLFPYISTSFREFWKRWHISLSSFLMEYLYIPLGGNRKGKIRTYINLILVMLLGGLWHGAAWSYAIWGGVHGLALAIEKFLSDKVTLPPSRIIEACKMLMVFLFVSLAWLLFKLPDFSHIIRFTQALTRNFNMRDEAKIITYITLYSIPVIFYHFYYLTRKAMNVSLVNFENLCYGTMLFMIVVNSGSPGEFIYFQF